MRKLSHILMGLLLSGGVLTVLNVRANDIEPGKEFYSATHIVNPVVIDGDLSDFAGVPVLADPKFAIPKGSGTNGTYVLFEKYQGGTWSGPDDQTSAVQVAWDANNVYCGFVVTDDYHENMSGNAWNGDSIQLMIADATRTKQIALYNYALEGYEDDTGTFIPDPNLSDPLIVMVEAGPGGTTAAIKRDSVRKKTIYEIQMTAASLGLKVPLTAGTKFGLGMAINDGDGYLDNSTGIQYGQAGQEGQKGWGGLGAHSIVFGKTPQQTALITLSTNLPGTDRLFFSAINPQVQTFTFRATSKGASIVDPKSAKLLIDTKAVTLTYTASGDAYDFTYVASPWFLPGSSHTYEIDVKDTSGATVTTTGKFVTTGYVLLNAADKVTPDTSKPGFVWNVHQNPNDTVNNNTRPLQQLAGLLGQNFADPNATGIASGVGVPGADNQEPLHFEIPSTLNLDSGAGNNGDFQPEDQMPGVPGTSDAPTDGIAGEIIAYVDLPAGQSTFIINSDDGFRTFAGLKMNDFFQGTVAGEFEGPRGFADTSFDVYVQDAGTYGFRTIYEQGGGAANVEWVYVTTNGTKVLLNDTADGAPKAWRAATSSAPAYVKAVSPAAGNPMLFPPTTVAAVLEDAATTVSANSITLKLNGKSAPVTATKTGGETRVIHTVNGDVNAGAPYTAELAYSDDTGPHTVTWTFTAGPLTTNLFVIEAEDYDYNGGQANPQKGTSGMDVDVMPYNGGAYDSLLGVLNIDYYNDDGNENGPGTVGGDAYRHEDIPVPATNPHHVDMYSSDNAAGGNGLGGDPPINSSDRGTYTTTVNYNIGWVGSPDWCNYTRNFPDNKQGGWWKVYAALSYGGTADGQLAGDLALVTAGAGTTNQTLSPLGYFSGPGSGAWGANNLVPMKTAAGDTAVVNLIGKKTLRYNMTSGDYNFLMFVASSAPQPAITFTYTSSQLTLTWTGGGTLLSAATVTGQYNPVAGNPPSPATVPITGKSQFFKIQQ
jgi:hypothetical protein